MTGFWIWGLFVFIGSFVGVELFRRACVKYRWLDIPNSRSSHVQPTPRGGGTAVVFFVSVGFCLSNPSPELRILALLGLGIAILGFVDDRVGVPAVVRFISQIVAASVGLYAVVGQTILVLKVDDFQVAHGAVAIGLAVFFVVWMTNLYNFMDGIDGIEGIQVLTVGLLAAFFSWEKSELFGAQAYLLLATGAAGFLWWNWSPARIFLGDVGSGFFGFFFGMLAIFSASSGVLQVGISLILHATFLADTIYTLVRRIAQGEKPHVAHRTHAYQKLTQKGFSHGWVSAAYGSVNLLWLGPIAWLVFSELVPAWVGLVVAYIPLFGICYRTRAGTREQAA
ncbi:MAG: glycosyltransferase family 4 protein [Bdellovibrionota bacterium]